MRSLEITPPHVFYERRRFLKALGGVLALGTASCEMTPPAPPEALIPPIERPDVFPADRDETFPFPASVRRKEVTPRAVAGAHNNFYEFLEGRGGPVWRYVGAFEVEPWTVEVKGECDEPATFALDDLFKIPHEERVCHFRCVERWAMNVPWSGFPLRTLLERVKPRSKATHVRFVSARRPEQMPGLRGALYYPWPYHEGLRMDEAMHDLALLATGVYGKPLLKQHGAPVRLVVPWKYGYKSPKSIVQIILTSEQPSTFWQIQPHEYGFLSNVNPNIPHPRWSQQTSYWLDTGAAFETPIFNGYEEQVGHLYPDEPRSPQQPLAPGDRAR
jgi:sulfoxide reductase catalytic subunit YedY